MKTLDTVAGASIDRSIESDAAVREIPSSAATSRACAVHASAVAQVA
jgi:hypothetical protein